MNYRRQEDKGKKEKKKKKRDMAEKFKWHKTSWCGSGRPTYKKTNGPNPDILLPSQYAGLADPSLALANLLIQTTESSS